MDTAVTVFHGVAVLLQPRGGSWLYHSAMRENYTANIVSTVIIVIVRHVFYQNLGSTTMPLGIHATEDQVSTK